MRISHRAIKKFVRFIRQIVLANGEFDYEISDRPFARPVPVATPEPEPHVMANYCLSNELEAEYLNEPRKYRAGRPSSFIAKKRFHDRFNLTKEQQKREFFEELNAAIAGLEKPVASPVPQKTYEQIIREFGGRFVGCSEVMPLQRQRKTMLVGEL